MIRSALERQRIYAQMSRGADELEPALLAALEQAGCTREQVGAHLALGLYYLQRGDTARVQAHLSFVAAHGNKLKVREEAACPPSDLPQQEAAQSGSQHTETCPPSPFGAGGAAASVTVNLKCCKGGLPHEIAHCGSEPPA